MTSELRMSWSSIQEEYANANSEFLVCESEAGKNNKAIKECRSARRETKRELFDRVDNIVVAAEERMEGFIRGSQLRYHRSIWWSATEAAVSEAKVEAEMLQGRFEGYGAMLLSLCVAAEESWEVLRRHPARGIMVGVLRDLGDRIEVGDRVCGEVRTGDLYLTGEIGE